jgi:nucleotidyltransferase/DNA polymerase involved in DNA repair
MRIACLHVPQFALQCLTRIDPSLRGAPVAVVSVGGGAPAGIDARAQGTPRDRALFSPVVQACSRAAWALGIRLGMTATAANGTAPGQLRVVGSDGALERETIRAIADALLGVSSVVDVGGRVGPGGAHLALYCEVPSKTRGTSYGDRLLEVVETLGLTGRIGIADDRFTAWVAAAHGGLPTDEGGVVSVPRGGSAAFLSPMPLSLLAITPEVQHMLEALGVRTLGEFAALPAPSVARPLEADYQALARGDSGTGLRPYAPEAPIREEAVLSPASGGGAAIAMLADRIALRLVGRARGAARIEVTVSGSEPDRVIPITAAMARLSSLASMGERASGGLQVLESAEALAEALGKALGEDLATAWRLKASVTAEAIAGDALAEPAIPASPPIELLGVVLGTTGALGTWQLTSPTGHGASALRSERRDAHRRTRHGKQRPRVRAELVQPRLFADHK